MNEQQIVTLEKQLQEKRGAAIIEGRQEEFHMDGYTNMLNKYGTKQDNSMAYQYNGEMLTTDMELVRLYEGNGLFTKIIDRPSEEAVKHGLDIDFGDEDIAEYIEGRLDELDFEAKFATAEKWARLYGGSIIVMLVDDGGGLEDPLNWNDVRSIEELRVFERAIVQPDYTMLNNFHFMDTMKTDRPFGEPEYYQVFSLYGYFRVHRSRCLVFRNGKLPEQTTNAIYRYWGIPEYVKIKRALRECITSHEDGVKLLERSVQAIYKMKNLANILSTDNGEDKVIQRLQVIDMARGILNSIAIDTEGEDYDYKSFSLSGTKDIIDASCNMLSAVTDIPQTILFGRSPAGMNSTGDSDFENYYNMVENIQKMNMKKNVRTVIDLILKQGKYEGSIQEKPKYKVKFAALWSMSETEQASVEKTKADTEHVKAQTEQIYMETNVIDPSEVRQSLAKDGRYDIEEEVTDNDLNLPEDTFDLEETISITGIDVGTDEDDNIISIQESETDDDNTISIEMDADKIAETNAMMIHIRTDNIDGGIGSGNWGHAGTPGKRGGSAKGSGGASHRTGSKESGFSSAAKERAKQKAGGGPSSSSLSARTKPSVKSPKEFDEYVEKNGLTTMYRGYSAKTQEQQEEYSNSIKEGKSPISGDKTSALGEGVYFTNSKEEAESYMHRRKEERGEKYGRVSTAALDVDAKIGDHYELQVAKFNEATECMNKAFEAKDKGDEQTYNAMKDKYYSLQEMGLGEYALNNGYDAMYHSGEKTTIVVNQNALVVRDDSLDSDGGDFQAAAVIIIHGGKILCASRSNSEGICGPGGKIEAGETTEEAAIRETMEEFNIVPHNLIPLGEYKAGTGSYLNSMVYFTDEFTGTPEADGKEMLNEQWLSMEELRSQSLFPPFEASLDMLTDLLKNHLTTSDTTDTITTDGGSGSGRYPKGSGKKNSKNKSKKKSSLSITSKERAKVGHDINNVYHAKYKGKRTCFIKTRSNETDSPFYLYRFKNNGFGDYDIYSKEDYK